MKNLKQLGKLKDVAKKSKGALNQVKKGMDVLDDVQEGISTFTEGKSTVNEGTGAAATGGASAGELTPQRESFCSSCIFSES